MLLGHWGTTPGQNFIYVHLNRVIRKYDLDMIYVSGPGHGGPAVVANTYLEGTYSEIYPNISQDEAGLRKLFVQFSFPGGIPSHASPEMPGLDPRRRRAGLFAQPFVRGGVRQSRSHRRLRRRRRRGGNRPAGHRVAFQQVSRSGHRRRGAADPAPERLQDCQSRPSSPASRARNWNSCSAAMAGRPTSSRATSPGRCTRRWRRRSTRRWKRSGTSSRTPASTANADAPALADDRPRVTQGLDRTEGGRWPAGRRHVPCAPGAALGPGHASRTPQACWKTGCGATGRKNFSTTRAA